MATKSVNTKNVTKWMAGLSIAGVATVLGLFGYLSSIGAITITGYSGDMVCSGNATNPCYAYINFTVSPLYNLSITKNNTWFTPSIPLKDLRLEQLVGKKWTLVNLTKTSLSLKSNVSYQFRFVGYKYSQYDNVKWSFGFPNTQGYIDPEWKGEKDPVEHDYSYDTFTNSDGSKTTAVYSGIRNVYEDDRWKTVEEARSLKGKGFEVNYIKKDLVNDFDVIDFNLTSITFAIVTTNSSKNIIFKNGDTVTTLDKTKQYTILTDNILDTNFTLGEKSTTINISQASNGNTGDSLLDNSTPDTNNGNSAVLQVGNRGNSNLQTIIKFNTSWLPSTANIMNSTLYIMSASCSGTCTPASTPNLTVWGIQNQTWDELQITTNRLNSMFLLPSNVTFVNWNGTIAYGYTSWMRWNVTSWTTWILKTGMQNVTFLVNQTGWVEASNLNMRSKEYATILERPMLNVTWREGTLNGSSSAVWYELGETIGVASGTLDWCGSQGNEVKALPCMDRFNTTSKSIGNIFTSGQRFNWDFSYMPSNSLIRLANLNISGSAIYGVSGTNFTISEAETQASNTGSFFVDGSYAYDDDYGTYAQCNYGSSNCNISENYTVGFSPYGAMVSQYIIGIGDPCSAGNPAIVWYYSYSTNKYVVANSICTTGSGFINTTIPADGISGKSVNITTQINSGGAGYFIYIDGLIYWDGGKQNFPNDVMIDDNSDGYIDHIFNGTLQGTMFNTSYFWDRNTSKILTINSMGSNVIYVTVPNNASVTLLNFSISNLSNSSNFKILETGNVRSVAFTYNQTSKFGWAAWAGYQGAIRFNNISVDTWNATNDANQTTIRTNVTDVSIISNAANLPFIAFKNGSTLYVLNKTAVAWSPIALLDNSVNFFGKHGLAVNTTLQSTVAVTYLEANYTMLKYFNGVNWMTTNVSPAIWTLPGYNFAPSITTDDNNNNYLVWINESNSSSHQMQIVYAKGNHTGTMPRWEKAANATSIYNTTDMVLFDPQIVVYNNKPTITVATSNNSFIQCKLPSVISSWSCEVIQTTNNVFRADMVSTKEQDSKVYFVYDESLYGDYKTTPYDSFNSAPLDLSRWIPQYTTGSVAVSSNSMVLTSLYSPTDSGSYAYMKNTINLNKLRFNLTYSLVCFNSCGGSGSPSNSYARFYINNILVTYKYYTAPSGVCTYSGTMDTGTSIEVRRINSTWIDLYRNSGAGYTRIDTLYAGNLDNATVLWKLVNGDCGTSTFSVDDVYTQVNSTASQPGLYDSKLKVLTKGTSWFSSEVLNSTNAANTSIDVEVDSTNGKTYGVVGVNITSVIGMIYSLTPSNISIDVGADGITEYTSGSLVPYTLNATTSANRYLINHSTRTVNIPIVISAITGGQVLVNNLILNYTVNPVYLNFTALNLWKNLNGTNTSVRTTYSTYNLSRRSSFNYDSGLYAWWRFEEGNGTVFVDSSNMSNNLTCTQCPQFNSTGYSNGSYNFNQTAASATSGTVFDFRTTNFTISFWMFNNGFKNLGSSFNIITAPNFDVSSQTSWAAATTSTNALTVRIGNFDLSCSGTTLNTWNLITFTVDTNETRIYKNGVLCTNQSYANRSKITDTSQVILIARDASAVRYWNGTIDEYTVFNRVLSASDVSQLFNSFGYVYDKNMNATIRVETATSGIVNISTLNVTYYGDQNVTLVDTANNTARIVWSNFSFSLPYRFTTDLLVYPKNATQQNVTPFNQTSTTPFWNITPNSNYLMDIYLKQSMQDPCMFLTISNDSSKTNGVGNNTYFNLTNQSGATSYFNSDYRNFGGMSDNLVAYWKFEYNISNNISDVVNGAGSGATNATIINNVTNLSGYINNGEYFQGGRNYLIVANSSVFNLTSNSGAIAFWVNYTGMSNSTQYPAVISKNSYGPGYPGYSCYFSASDSALRCNTGNSTASVGTSSTTTAAAFRNTWKFVVFTWNSTNQYLYINGSMQSSGTTAQNMDSSYFNLYIGMSSSGENYYYGFNGTIDELAIWNRSMSSQEVNDIYRLGRSNTLANFTELLTSITTPNSYGLWDWFDLYDCSGSRFYTPRFTFGSCCSQCLTCSAFFEAR
jgi:hypothetical protein